MVAQQAYNKAVAVTPSDTVNYEYFRTNQLLAEGLYVGGAGTVTLVLQDDTAVQFTAVAGGYLKVRHKRVNSTGTAATLMVALFNI